jgi:hypothetical protein
MRYSQGDKTFTLTAGETKYLDVEGNFYYIRSASGGPVQLRFDLGQSITRKAGEGASVPQYSRIDITSDIAQTIIITLGFGTAITLGSGSVVGNRVGQGEVHTLASTGTAYDASSGVHTGAVLYWFMASGDTAGAFVFTFGGNTYTVYIGAGGGANSPWTVETAPYAVKGSNAKVVVTSVPTGNCSITFGVGTVYATPLAPQA